MNIKQTDTKIMVKTYLHSKLPSGKPTLSMHMRPSLAFFFMSNIEDKNIQESKRTRSTQKEDKKQRQQDYKPYTGFQSLKIRKTWIP